MIRTHASSTPQELIHESKIPSITSKTRDSKLQPENVSTTTTLSFATPKSLAFFKRFTWELTPWTRPNIDPTTATAISAHIPTLPADAIHLAICLGVGYTAFSKACRDQRPHLYVVFPHLRRPIDEQFWRVWHTNIVKPAFDEAWISSGLVDVWEREDTAWITEKAAPTADQVLDRYDNAPSYRRQRPQQIQWPEWRDFWEFDEEPSPRTLSKGSEGGFSYRRALVFDEAWSAMRDMLKGGDELREMSDPILLALWEKAVEVEEPVSADVLIKTVGKEWDAYIDLRFVEKNMFVVHLVEPTNQNNLHGQGSQPTGPGGPAGSK
ncbi:hypothetical protein SLS60_008015 [Paraconiothyrium brasiliense]|uniref:Uncharacterized protein n=1 Tax=Paraconiothyrium brasiliense TaxID=300254 RepID=A0ABR3R4E4_9PLEO